MKSSLLAQGSPGFTGAGLDLMFLKDFSNLHNSMTSDTLYWSHGQYFSVLLEIFSEIHSRSCQLKQLIHLFWIRLGWVWEQESDGVFYPALQEAFCVLVTFVNIAVGRAGGCGWSKSFWYSLIAYCSETVNFIDPETPRTTCNRFR